MQKRKKGGFGTVYQNVTRNSNISAAAKGLYAYLASFCDSNDECYPSIETITKEMAMGKDTFYRHINTLVAMGVVIKAQVKEENGKFGRTIYKLTHEVVIHDFQYTENSETVKPITEVKETNNTNINNTNINNTSNNINISPEPDKSALNPSGILLPLNDNTIYDVPLEKIEIWRKAYPVVNIEGELYKMIAWLESNPTRRKTKRGINSFINNWLAKEQNRGGTYRSNTYDGRIRQQQEEEQRQREYAERVNNAMKFDWSKVPSRPDDPFQ